MLVAKEMKSGLICLNINCNQVRTAVVPRITTKREPKTGKKSKIIWNCGKYESLPIHRK